MEIEARSASLTAVELIRGSQESAKSAKGFDDENVIAETPICEKIRGEFDIERTCWFVEDSTNDVPSHAMDGSIICKDKSSRLQWLRDETSNFYSIT